MRNLSTANKLMLSRLMRVAGCTTVASVLGGCLATLPDAGGDSATVLQGAAAGTTTVGANSGLERCQKALGTVRIEEDTNASWYSYYNSHYHTGSTVPILRMLVQQSNCFVVVERNQRAMQHLNSERELMRSEEGRAGSKMGGGQMVAADYTMTPEIMMSDKGGMQGGGFLSGLGGKKGQMLNAVSGSISTNEAGTTLLLVDVRSGVQIAAAEGYAKNVDFGFAGSLLRGSAGASAFTSTPEGKVILSAFVDSYNKMIVALRNYRAQTVDGGLGAGGELGVQGGDTRASKKIRRK